MSEVPIKTKKRKKAKKEREKKKKGFKSDDEGKPKKRGKKRTKLQRSRTAKELSLNMNFENFLKAVTRRPSHPRSAKTSPRKRAPKTEASSQDTRGKNADLNAMIAKELSKLGKGNFSHIPKESLGEDEHLLNNYETFECRNKDMSKSTPGEWKSNAQSSSSTQSPEKATRTETRRLCASRTCQSSWTRLQTRF